MESLNKMYWEQYVVGSGYIIHVVLVYLQDFGYSATVEGDDKSKVE